MRCFQLKWLPFHERHSYGWKSVVSAAILFYSVYTVHAQCPPYTVIRAHTIELSPEDNLNVELRSVTSNTTVYLTSGTYAIASNLQIRVDSITLRSKTGNRDDVILDGNNGGTALDRSNFTPEVVAIAASDVHLVDLTVRYARDHGIHLYAPADRSINGCIMHNIHVYDCGQQLIKVNSNGDESQPCWVDGGILEGSLVEFIDNSVMDDQGSYYYTGGLDVHGGEGWIVRWNLFRNIQRDGKLMEHAVHFWSRSRGTLVENNRFENTYRAIGFGMKRSPDGLVRSYADGAGEDPYVDHLEGILRNNVIFNREGVHLETGIELMNVLNTQVYHTTIYSVDEPFNSMEYRWPDTKVIIANNLVSHRIMERDGGRADLHSNITTASAEYFIDAASGDLHLAESAENAIDKAMVLDGALAGCDLHGTIRGALPDVGAYEYSSEGVMPFNSIVRHQSKPTSTIPHFYTLDGRRLPLHSAWYGTHRAKQLLVAGGGKEPFIVVEVK